MSNNKLYITSLIFLSLLFLILPLRWLLAAIIAAAVHELGHYFAVCLLGGKIRNIRFGMTGAVMEATNLSVYSEILCIMAGPLAGLLLSISIRIFPAIALCAIVQSAYNLLPIYPLDGGKALRCIILIFGGTERCFRYIEYITLLLLFLGCIYVFFRFRISLFLFFAVFLFRKTPCKPQRDWI